MRVLYPNQHYNYNVGVYKGAALYVVGTNWKHLAAH